MSKTPNSEFCHVVWLTGLPGAGKTTIVRTVAERLRDAGRAAVVLDGDDLRGGVCADLGFTPEDRIENVRRVGELAHLLSEQGFIALCALVSPYRASRDRVRGLFPDGRFLEVHVKADSETCRRRDPKGLYARAAGGEVRDLTGVGAPYEEPLAPELTIDTTSMTPDAAADLVIGLIGRRV
jgi:adenylyl-sulfate kinase